MFPKTLIIGINSHGEIPLDNQGNPETTKFKLNQMIQLNAVTCGVANISTFDTYHKLSEIVADYIDETPLDWGKQHNKEELMEYVKILQDLLVKNNMEERKDIEKMYKRVKNSELLEQLHRRRYIHTDNKSYNISYYKEGDTITNKLFYKFSPEEIEFYGLDDEIIEDAYFNKIFVYNDEYKTNIFDLLESQGVVIEEITLFNLIDYLGGMGIENIILLDLSCSVFKDNEGKPLSDRAIRRTRRTMENEQKKKKLGGRRTRKTKKGIYKQRSNKRRNTNKRRVKY